MSSQLNSFTLSSQKAQKRKALANRNENCDRDREAKEIENLSVFNFLRERDENRQHYETVLVVKKEVGHESSELCFSRSLNIATKKNIQRESACDPAKQKFMTKKKLTELTKTWELCLNPSVNMARLKGIP